MLSAPVKVAHSGAGGSAAGLQDEPHFLAGAGCRSTLALVPAAAMIRP
jgi:hypothetical protein